MTDRLAPVIVLPGKTLFFSEEKNQKTFAFVRRARKSGTWPESPIMSSFAHKDAT
jgi:hypothetical protein